MIIIIIIITDHKWLNGRKSPSYLLLLLMKTSYLCRFCFSFFSSIVFLGVFCLILFSFGFGLVWFFVVVVVVFGGWGVGA